MIYTITKSTVFYILLALWTILLGIILFPYLFLPTNYIYKTARLWTRGVFFLLRNICSLNYEVIGEKYLINNHSKIIASKHQSAFETFLFFYIIPKAVFIHKYELFFIPIFGWYLKKINMLSIDRTAGHKAMRKILNQSQQKALQGYNLVIFPEGTRKLPGSKPNYKSGVAGIYKELNSSVLPVSLNSGLFWPKHSFIIKPGKITVEFLPPIEKGLPKKIFLKKLEDIIESKSTALIN